MLLRALVRRLRELGEGSSLHGLPKIVSSQQVVFKIFWTLIVVGASVLLGLQLDALYQEYSKYPTKTSINVGYGALEFPSVTVCNINPIKLSNLDYFPNASTIIKGPKEIDNAVTRNPVDLHYSGTSESPPRRPGGQTNPSMSSCNAQGPTEESPIENSNRDEQSTSNPMNGYDVPVEPMHNWHTLRQRFLISLRDTKQSLRLLHGHGKNDLILMAMYHESAVPLPYLKPVLSGEYGTCFTINVEIDTDTAGPKTGMQLVLFVDKDEYIEETSDGFGVKVTIHERGTFPMPTEEGLLLNPGYLTSVGMRRKTIKKQGPPYSQCIEGEEFKEKYGFEYSVPVCLAVCRLERVWDNCGCVPYLSPEVIDVDTDRKVCPWRDSCTEGIVEEIKADISSCNCLAKCHEHVYETRISSMRWPSHTYLQNTIYEEVCSRNISSLNKTCEDLRSKILNFTDENYKGYSENFASLRIFYESLAQETITEEPLYSTITFLSDVGGSMGFFLGASLITYLELIHLLVELLICLCKRCCWTGATVSPEKSTSTSNVQEKENN